MNGQISQWDLYSVIRHALPTVSCSHFGYQINAKPLVPLFFLQPSLLKFLLLQPSASERSFVVVAPTIDVVDVALLPESAEFKPPPQECIISSAKKQMQCLTTIPLWSNNS